MNTELNQHAKRLQKSLLRAEQLVVKKSDTHDKVHVVGVGGTLTSAYEQLRNAAEYTEEHLLLQGAIKRFFRRLFVLRDRHQLARSGNELIIELTLAGYLPNDSIDASLLSEITKLADQYYKAYVALEKCKQLSQDQASRWTLDVLAVRIERRLSDHQADEAFIEFAYESFSDSIDAKKLFRDAVPEDYSVALFVAVWRALLHADDATIRQALIARYRLTPEKIDSYKAFNLQLDSLFASDVVRKIFYVVNREGAPQRVLRQSILSTPGFASLMKDKTSFVNVFTQQVDQEYTRIESRINRAIVKSVIFLAVTKTIVGVAIEVPYDKIVHGEILWLPLLINLFFPPFYMILLRATLVLPGSANTRALVDRGIELLFTSKNTVTLRQQSYRNERASQSYVVLYTIFALAVFAGVIWLLLQLQFSWLHIIIFFIFLSTASFLGFRLSRMVREIEVVEADQSAVSLIRDAFYMPFVAIGRRLSDAYSQINVMTLILDMMIELPLKTILRLIRQWGAFISDRQDRI